MTRAAARQRRRSPEQVLVERLEALERAALALVARVYRGNEAWILNAWRLETLAEEELPGQIAGKVEELRRNLYAYIASLGAEWSPEEEDTLLLRGSYLDAAKTLKALWLSLHLARLAPAQLEAEPPAPEEAYPLYEAYVRLHAEALQRYKPLPFLVADRMLEAAAALAMATGFVDPGIYEDLGVPTVVADMLYVLSKTMA